MSFKNDHIAALYFILPDIVHGCRLLTHLVKEASSTGEKNDKTLILQKGLWTLAFSKVMKISLPNLNGKIFASKKSTEKSLLGVASPKYFPAHMEMVIFGHFP